MPPNDSNNRPELIPALFSPACNPPAAVHGIRWGKAIGRWPGCPGGHGGAPETKVLVEMTGRMRTPRRRHGAITSSALGVEHSCALRVGSLMGLTVTATRLVIFQKNERMYSVRLEELLGVGCRVEMRGACMFIAITLVQRWPVNMYLTLDCAFISSC